MATTKRKPARKAARKSTRRSPELRALLAIQRAMGEAQTVVVGADDLYLFLHAVVADVLAGTQSVKVLGEPLAKAAKAAARALRTGLRRRA